MTVNWYQIIECPIVWASASSLLIDLKLRWLFWDSPQQNGHSNLKSDWLHMRNIGRPHTHIILYRGVDRNNYILVHSTSIMIASRVNQSRKKTNGEGLPYNSWKASAPARHLALAVTPGGASGVICWGMLNLWSPGPAVASEGELAVDEDLDSVATAQAGAFSSGRLTGEESTRPFKACLAELGVFLSAFSALLSSFLINLLSTMERKLPHINCNFTFYMQLFLPLERHWCCGISLLHCLIQMDFPLSCSSH